MIGRGYCRLLLCGWLLLPASVVALPESDALPQPLTLEAALALAGSAHPSLNLAEAAVAAAQADLRAARADRDSELHLDGRLRWLQPSPIAADQDHGDHALALVARRTLADFGRTASRTASAGQQLQAREANLAAALDQHRLTIMRRFFDVLLSDMQFALASEQMAIDYVTLDRLRDRQQLGQISDVDLLQMESEYQQSRLERQQAAAAQRQSRARLALALGRPGQLPSELVPPQLTITRELPPIDHLLAQALVRNPQLLALRAEVAAAERSIAAARADSRPRVDGHVELLATARELGSSDRWRAGVTFALPIYQGDRIDAAVAAAQAKLFDARARLTAAEYALREELLTLWLTLSNAPLQQERVAAQLAFRDLYLDRSRTNYELEVKADLGDAMVRLTEAQLNEAKTLFDTALAWQRLGQLSGENLSPSSTGESH